MRKQELRPITANINKKQKNQSRMARNEALRWLASTFPKAFDNTLAIHPLKSGIMKDILAHAAEAEAAGISISKIREAVVVFTRRIDYLTVLKAREMRVDLWGNPVDQVSEEEAEHAAEKIKKRVEKGARNARKNGLSKSSDPAHGFQSLKPPVPNFIPQYPERSIPFGALSEQSKVKATSIMVKQKATRQRQLDPDAVARLKEKLGLARKTEAVDKK